MLNWENISIGEALKIRFNNDGDSIAIGHKGEKITYNELYKISSDIALGLNQLGIKKGDHIATLFDNVPEWIFVKYALHFIGAVIVPINVNFRTREIQFILQQGDIKTIITKDSTKYGNHLELIESIDPKIKENKKNIKSEILPKLEKIITVSPDGKNYQNCYDLENLITIGSSTGKNINSLLDKVKPSDVCNILFTSGSTAFPKGAMHRHTSLLGIGFNLIKETFRMKPNSKILCNFPFYHIAGCVYFPLGALTGRYELYINEFVSSEVINIIEKEKINFFCGFEAHFNALANDSKFDSRKLKSVENILLACGPEWYDKCKNIFTEAKIISHHYGLTEGTGVSVEYNEKDYKTRKFTNGKPWKGIEVKIVDPITGERIHPNLNGELCLKGWNLFLGYYNNDQETTKAFDNEGFFHSGDYGCKDEKGNICYKGRYKMMIKTGGENVSERELEMFLESMPGVRSVQVIGLPDEKWGESVTAVIEKEESSKITEEDVIKFCKSKISRFKIPKKVFFIRSGEWPLLGSGKINKIFLKKLIIEKLTF